MTWWKWSLVALGVVFVVFVAAYGVGALLPVGHTATVSAELDAAPERVWALITDVEGYPAWRPDVRSVTLIDGGDGPTWRETTDTGALTFVAEAWDPPRRMVARIADEGLPFGGRWTYVVESAGRGTRLTITEDGEVYDPLFRFMARFVFGHDATMQAYIDAARTELEGGPG